MDHDLVTLRRAEWEAVLDRLAVVEGQLARRHEPPTGPRPVGAPSDGADGPEVAPDPAVSPVGLTRRRALVGLAGAAGAGVVMAAAAAQPAAASNGDPLIVGSSANASTASTVLTVGGEDRFYGMAVVDNAIPANATGTAILGSATGAAFNTAVRAVASGSSRAIDAVSATGSTIRATSTAGTAVSANAGGQYGVYTSNSNPEGVGVAALATGTALFAAGRDAILFSPTIGETPPERGGTGARGAVAVDGTGTLWYCIESGAPGTWRQLCGGGAAGALHVLTAPKRVYDSRPGTQPAIGSKTPLTPNVARVLDLKANGSTVPAGCTAAVLTILLVNAAGGNGNVTVWANGVTKPAANTMVWGPSGGRFSTQTLTGVSGGAGIQVVSSVATDIVIDVVGYYR